MYLDPTVVSWLLIGAASVCAFMIGRNSVHSTEDIIENTIMYLIENNYVKARQTQSGEWDLISLDEE